VHFLQGTPSADLRGKLHPRTTRDELWNLARDIAGAGDHAIQRVVIGSTRGCAVIPIPDEAMSSSDRCYGTVEFAQSRVALKVWKKCTNARPILHGLSILVGVSPADLPDVVEILVRTKILSPDTLPEYVGSIRLFAQLFADDGFRLTRRPTSKRIAKQDTECVIEGEPKGTRPPSEPRPLAGPSRQSSKPKQRKNPAGGVRTRKARN
jgi:hypothetical protein